MDANALLKEIGLHVGTGENAPRNRRLVLTVVALLSGKHLPQSWLDDSLEAYRSERNKEKPWAFLKGCLARRAEVRGVDLNAAIDACPVPTALLRKGAA